MRILLAILAAPLLLAAALLLIGAVATLVISLIIEARYPPEGRFVAVAEGRGRLHLIDRQPSGTARGTVVLIHGASGNAHDPLLALGEPLLAKGFRVVAVDRPGHGWSDRVDGSAAAAPARQAALVAEGLRAAGVSEAIVLGHSFAGAIVPNLALDHRDVTGAILMLAPVTHPWPGGGVSWYYHPATSVLGWLFTRTITTPVGAYLAPRTTGVVFAPQPPEPDYVERAHIPLVLRPRVFQANAEDVAGLHAAVTTQKQRYPAIAVPATVIGGEADRIVSTDIHARSFAREVPGAKLVTLPGVGHMLHFASRDRVVAEVEALAQRMAGQGEATPPPVPP